MLHSNPEQFHPSARILPLPARRERKPAPQGDPALLAEMRQRPRPRLLITAAGLARGGYRRRRELRRLLHCDTPPEGARAMRMLLIEEDRLDQARRSGGADYSLARHLDLWIALLAEAEAQYPGM